MFILSDMTDLEALDFLIPKFGRQKLLAEALGVSPQVLHNWRARERISPEKRPSVWAMVNDHGGHLSREWLMSKATPQPEQAA